MNNNGELNNVSVNPTPAAPVNPGVAPTPVPAAPAQPVVNQGVPAGDPTITQTILIQDDPNVPAAQPQGGNVTLMPMNENNSVIIDQTAPAAPAPVAPQPQQPLSKKEQKALEKAEAKKQKEEQKKAIAEARAQQAAAAKGQPAAPAPDPQQSVAVDPNGALPQDPNAPVNPNAPVDPNAPVAVQPVPQQKGSFVKSLVLILLVVAVGYIFYTNRTYKSNIAKLTYECTPVTKNTEETDLDVNSTLVQTLYQKVRTTIKEDVAQPEWDANVMRLYLAYRTIPANDKYESNCNMFEFNKMPNYKCEVTPEFVPYAFKEETLVLAYKNLYGESSEPELEDIKLEKACVGGYQYIPERKEFVQGECTQPSSTPLKAEKELKEAKSYRNTIVLVEDVKYTGADKVEKPEYLKNGTYYYTFKLDMNYNFVLVAKTFNEPY